ncbi:hypothetical protein Tco_0387396 [Tanacetum coccineum]
MESLNSNSQERELHHEMTEKLFAEYTRIQVKQFRETLLLHMGNVKKSVAERTRHKRQYGRRMNERQMQSRENEHITSSSSGTYITHVVDVNIRPVNDQVPSAEGIRYCPRAEQYQVKCPLLNVELVKSKEIIEKEKYNELSHRFLLLEKHCISLELEIQHKDASFQSNKPGKNHDVPEFHEFFKINDLKAQLLAKTTLICNLKNQIKSVNEASNEAKVKNDIDVIETINIELEHSVAKLLAANEQLHKENEHLKHTYKELYVSIKKTHVQNKDNSDSLISQINQKSVENADLKAQIQEKIAIGQRFSLNKSSAMHEKPNTPRSCLRNQGFKEVKCDEHEQMMSADNTSGSAPQRKEKFQEVPTLVPAASTSSPSSTTVGQDAPSTSTSQTTSEQQSLVIPQGVEDDFYEIEVAHMDNDPYFGILIPEPSSEETTLQGVIPSNFHHLNQSFATLTKLTKKQPLENVIGDPS